MADTNSALGSFLGTSAGLVSVIGTVYAAINHKKIVAKCCGRKYEFEIHVDDTKDKQSVSSSTKVLPEETVIQIPKHEVEESSSNSVKHHQTPVTTKKHPVTEISKYYNV